MASKVPIKATFTGSDVTGLAEFTAADYVDIADGGTGLTSIGTAGQVLVVNSGASALEYQTLSQTITLAADSGSNDTYTTGETLTFSGLSGITTIVSDNSISIDLDDTAVTPGSYGSATTIPTFTVDQQGRLTAAGSANIATTLTVADDSSTNANISLLSDTLTINGGTGLTSSISGNTLSIDLDNTAVTPGSYGSSTAVPQITVDQFGRFTSLITSSISI